MKRFPCFLLALLLLFSAVSISSPHAAAQTLTGYCGNNEPEGLVWTLDTDTGFMTFSGYASMADYAPGTAPWSAYHADIVYVEVADGVVSIGSNAFAVAIPENAPTNASTPTKGPGTVVPQDDTPATPANPNPTDPDPTEPTEPTDPPPATAATPATPTTPSDPGTGSSSTYSKLSSVTLPPSVEEIGVNAFAGCSVLTRLTIKNRECKIGEGLNDPQRLTIYGYAGSTAQSYAQTYGYRFIALAEEAHEHSWSVTRRKEAGCEVNGAIYYFCAGCGTTKTDIIPALGHDEVTDPRVAPTCTESGLTAGSHCARCSAVLTAQEDIPALGHSWNAGTVTREPTLLLEGERLFTCTRCGGSKTEPIERLWFEDVPKNKFYAKAVEWAVLSEITTGTSSTKFSPNKTCTRGQVVTFLWRAAGSPQPENPTNPFFDVKPDDFFYTAVLWAVEQRITSGTSSTKFSPKGDCTRGHVVTFLWRAAGTPAPTQTTHPFTDVKPTAFYYTAMLWAVEQGITEGVKPTKFAPNNPCTRAQVVTFLWRAAGQPEVENSIIP